MRKTTKDRIKLLLTMITIGFITWTLIQISREDDLNSVLNNPPGYLVGLLAPIIFGFLGTALNIQAVKGEVYLLLIIFCCGILFHMASVFLFDDSTKRSALSNIGSGLMGVGLGVLFGRANGK